MNDILSSPIPKRQTEHHQCDDLSPVFPVILQQPPTTTEVTIRGTNQQPRASRLLALPDHADPITGGRLYVEIPTNTNQMDTSRLIIHRPSKQQQQQDYGEMQIYSSDSLLAGDEIGISSPPTSEPTTPTTFQRRGRFIVWPAVALNGQ